MTSIFDVRAFGAKGDGVSKDTSAIQQAIDAAHEAGGGEVLLVAGTYLSGSLFLKSNVDFHLAAGATLKGSPDPADYNAPDVCPQNSTYKPERSFGVLDLTSVKADTGLDIFELNHFGGYAGITGLVAPDVPSLPTRCFLNCSNLTCVVVTNVPPGKGANTEVTQRRSRLQGMGLWRDLLPRLNRVGYTHRSVLKTTVGNDVSVKGVKPGELYSVGFSMKRRGAGVLFASVRFKSDGKNLGAKKAIAMNGPRKDDVWRSGEAVVRVPEGANELYFDIYCEVYEGSGRFEFDKFQVYKIGDPPPVWPEESLRLKGQ